MRNGMRNGMRTEKEGRGKGLGETLTVPIEGGLVTTGLTSTSRTTGQVAVGKGAKHPTLLLPAVYGVCGVYGV